MIAFVKPRWCDPLVKGRTNPFPNQDGLEEQYMSILEKYDEYPQHVEISTRIPMR